MLANRGVAPVVWEKDNGTTLYFTSYWDDCKVSYKSDTETEILWHAHGCMTSPAGFDSFQKFAVSTTEQILEDRNQLVGVSSDPVTVVYPPEFAGVPCC